MVSCWTSLVDRLTASGGEPLQPPHERTADSEAMDESILNSTGEESICSTLPTSDVEFAAILMQFVSKFREEIGENGTACRRGRSWASGKTGLLAERLRQYAEL